MTRPSSVRPTQPGGWRELRISREARDRYGVDASLFATDGRVVLADPVAARRLAVALDAARQAEGLPPIEAGDLFAAGLVHEILHHVVDLYRRDVDRTAFEGALAAVEHAVGRDALDEVLAAFRERFPTAEGYRSGRAEPAADRGSELEELGLLWLQNANPALQPFRDLFDDRPLAESTAYDHVISALGAYFAGRPPFGPDGQPLVVMLRSPAIAVPDSISGQLAYIRERWGSLLGDLLARLLLGMDLLDEEATARWMRFHPGAGGAGAATSAALARFGVGAGDEPERFSEDRDWMPNVVLIAKSTYVWLDQLSRRYGREIRTLDAIPDEELETLRSWGVNGLWFIGLWQRSRASERIKRMRGNPEAVASAYSLDEYRIADDLGGEAAWASLRDRAWSRGIRLAADMVPNHMGIDSRWVVEHPERFLSLRESPYPAYSFSGADLSDDGRAAIRIEDHYWDGSDAAVVFQRVDTATGDVRYIYHGNDGTSFPWNDTAQLDYVNADVREAVIRAILDVARRFPIIRFDAAMTLAKRHIERLWYPVPGQGGAIPSRAEHAMTRAAFDAAMPEEFWREVVDRVAVEAPDTLLLAEAFWLMEGFFVRTLGMHRVYNSAFMHMLRDEDNAGYRSVMKNTLEFDPEVLKRYVNFMNNPDERTAVEQFGKGDKYFGVATLLATLPGLPMLGHGQVEGFAEKYGMEYRRAYLDEQPDRWLVERHERELFPLLHRRRQFAGVEHFLLYDLYRDDGTVDEDVFAYSNGWAASRSLVVYQNRFGSTAGWIRESTAQSVTSGGGRRLERRTLAAGWGLPNERDVVVRFRDQVTGLEQLHRASAIHERGLHVSLDAYGRNVFLDVAEVRDGAAGLWGRLADHLGGRGVPSLDAALRGLQLEPVHAALRRVFADDVLRSVVSSGADSGVAHDDALLSELTLRLDRFQTAVAETTGTSGPAGGAADEARSRLERVLALPRLAPAPDEQAAAAEPLKSAEPLKAAEAPEPLKAGEAPGALKEAEAPGAAGTPHPTEETSVLRRVWRDPVSRASLVGWALLSPMGRLAAGAPEAPTSRAWFEELRLAGVVANGLRSLGLDEGAAWAAAERIPVLMTLARPGTLEAGIADIDGRLVDAWLGDPAVRPLLGVNRWEGVEWFAKEPFEALLDLAAALDAVMTTERGVDRSPVVLVRLRRAAEEAGYRVDALRARALGKATQRAGATEPAAGPTEPGDAGGRNERLKPN